jgi:hypothetical protein
MVRSYVRRPVILGSVDEAGRQCGPGAGIGKYDGFCAECREHLEVSGSPANISKSVGAAK